MPMRAPVIEGLSLLGLGAAETHGRTFSAVNPATGDQLEPAFHASDVEDVAVAVERAEEAFEPYSALPAEKRAAFLGAIAESLDGTRAEIVERADLETALGKGRLDGELTRTANQLRMFADIVADGAWCDPRIDEGQADRQPAPKPDVRSMRRPIGPVGVFGASNFPLAFSVAGGDTASALAAGCPVVFKAHPAHPGTSELAARAIQSAVRDKGMPEGTFSLLFDDGYEAGRALVQHPLIRAVAFTGSRSGGQAMMALAGQRPEAIPVYAEMSSVNPFFVLPGASERRAEAIADGLAASFTVGVGQFCTNPGIVLLPATEAGDRLRDRLVERTREVAAQAMLASGIHEAYLSGLARLEHAGVRRVAEGKGGVLPTGGTATVWESDIGRALDDRDILQEVFGPSTVVLRYRDEGELLSFACGMEGQLTVTLHGELDEWGRYRSVVAALERRAGRLIVNQYPTGVEVCGAMVHGGPFPATSDGRTTSVGGRAIERFTRLVAYQNFPAELLPAELK